MLGGRQPINRADQDEIRPTPSTLNPRPWAVGLVDRVCGPRKPNEAMLLPLGVVFVQGEAQCVLEVLGNCRCASYMYAKRQLTG